MTWYPHFSLSHHEPRAGIGSHSHIWRDTLSAEKCPSNSHGVSGGYEPSDDASILLILLQDAPETLPQQQAVHAPELS